MNHDVGSYESLAHDVKWLLQRLTDGKFFSNCGHSGSSKQLEGGMKLWMAGVERIHYFLEVSMGKDDPNKDLRFWMEKLSHLLKEINSSLALLRNSDQFAGEMLIRCHEKVLGITHKIDDLAKQAEALLQANASTLGSGIAGTFEEGETDKDEEECDLPHEFQAIEIELQDILLSRESSWTTETHDTLVGADNPSPQEQTNSNNEEGCNPPEFHTTITEAQDVNPSIGGSETTEDHPVLVAVSIPYPKDKYMLMTFVAVSALLEAASMVFEQLSSPVRTGCALIWMVLSCVSMALWIVEFAYWVKSKGWGSWREMVSSIHMMEASVILSQVCFSTLEYVYVHNKHSRNPIKASFSGLIIDLVTFVWLLFCG